MSGCWISALASYRILLHCSGGRWGSLTWERNTTDLTWACCTICPAVLVSASPPASQGHQEEQELQRKRKFPLGECTRTNEKLWVQKASRSAVWTDISIRILVGLTRSSKRTAVKRRAAAGEEDSLDSPGQTSTLIHCVHLCSLQQRSVWPGDDTCLRTIKARHTPCANPQVNSPHLFPGEHQYSRTQGATAEVSWDRTCSKKQPLKKNCPRRAWKMATLHRWSLGEMGCSQLPGASPRGHVSVPATACHF